ncbi:MAG TPA: class I SAM-dependent methyltransferase [Trebonia sp.]|nr:class I SAM-dependent methyltransferase [Trebonia sp.]
MSTTSDPVPSDAGPNAAQAEAWNGDQGRHWADNAERQDRLFAEFASLMLGAAGIGDGDAVLDIGCGAGGTTLAAARQAGSGRVLGIDLSAVMLAEAARRAERTGTANARFEQADAQVRSFAGEFDVAVSRFGVMFFDDPAAAWANIARALRPGGRLAFCCWQDAEANEFFSVPRTVVAPLVPPLAPAEPEAPGPMSLASPDRVRSLLGGAGFTGIDVSPVTTTLRMGENPRDAAEYLTGMGPVRGMLADASPATRTAATAALRDVFASRATADGVRLGAAIWVVTARRG